MTTPGAPLDSWTFDRVFAKIVAYNNRTDPSDRTLDFGTFDLTSLPYGALPEDLEELYLHYSSVVEIDCALLPKTLEILNLRHCFHLERILNLDQLPNLRELNAEASFIQTVPRLPTKLRALILSGCRELASLPTLTRTELRRVEVNWCAKLDKLPLLPETLHTLCARGTSVRGEELNTFPDSIQHLDMDHTPAVNDGFLPERPDTVTHAEYAEIVRVWWNACLRKERYETLQEDLMAKAWHPDRVSKWLAAGESVLDNILGL